MASGKARREPRAESRGRWMEVIRITQFQGATAVLFRHLPLLFFQAFFLQWDRAVSRRKMFVPMAFLERKNICEVAKNPYKLGPVSIPAAAKWHASVKSGADRAREPPP